MSLNTKINLYFVVQTTERTYVIVQRGRESYMCHLPFGPRRWFLELWMTIFMTWTNPVMGYVCGVGSAHNRVTCHKVPVPQLHSRWVIFPKILGVPTNFHFGQNVPSRETTHGDNLRQHGATNLVTWTYTGFWRQMDEADWQDTWQRSVSKRLVEVINNWFFLEIILPDVQYWEIHSHLYNCTLLMPVRAW